VAALELRIPPVAVFLIAGAGMWLLGHYCTAAAVVVPGAGIIAAGCAAAGIAVGAAGLGAFRRHGTTVHPMHPGKASTVVSTGVYRFTRNPMYLGLALVLAGWAVRLGNVAGMLLLPLFMAYMTRFQIVPEERALLERFGADFSTYRARVRRWL
jgi:protein-S-isoprenylcysteine O-methyltransferase Ste14